MEDPVSYKGYFNSDAQEGLHEVRRFTVDKEKSNSLKFLKEKLATVFPLIKDKEIFITWRDHDGDMITIKNDEDLMIAKTEMQGHLYKINVTIKNENNKKEGKGKKERKEKKERKDEHPGVVCDGCGGSVPGFRFKCLVCQDYDLCEQCAAKGLHKEHNLVRLASSQPGVALKNLNKILERLNTDMKSLAYDMEGTTSVYGLPWGRGCMTGRGGGRRAMHRGFPLHKGPYPVGTMMEGWTVPEARNSESSSASYESMSTTHSPDTAHSDFHFIKLPEAEVHTAPAVAAGSAPNMAAAECSAPKDAPAATVECLAPKDAPAATVEFSAPKHAPATTVEFSAPKDAPSVATVEFSAPKDAPAATVECSAPKDAPATAVKCSDAKLQAAIQAMMKMGFNNEGGWLSNLLQAKNGDIGKVLDLLHPVKN